MHNKIHAINCSVSTFMRDEEGAQVVEYALIIAVVSIGLAVALGADTSSLKSSFTTLISRVSTCFTAGSTCL
jgi:pilus assembly protein Flp/PilA